MQQHHYIFTYLSLSVLYTGCTNYPKAPPLYLVPISSHLTTTTTLFLVHTHSLPPHDSIPKLFFLILKRLCFSFSFLSFSFSP